MTNALKYSSFAEEFCWVFPEASSRIADEYALKQEISGNVITTKSPLPPGQRGITLYANGRMVNEAEFFGFVESSNFYSYATGWLNVDFIDEDDGGEDDNIATNRKQLSWENEAPAKLKEYLRKIITLVHKEWRTKRKEKKIDEAQQSTGIDREKWLSTIPEAKAKVISEAIEKVSDPEFKDNYTEVLERAFHEIAPEYAEKHWRYLHNIVTGNDAIDRLYRGKNYFQAASEAVKLYITEVRCVSGISTAQQLSDNNVMGMAFGKDPSKKISLTDRSDAIELDIEQGQSFYSQGVVTGFKNPVTSHATETELKERGLFSEKDCLDVLSLISHMLKRLEGRKKP